MSKKCVACHDKNTIYKKLYGHLVCVLCFPFYKGMSKKDFETEMKNI